MGALPWPPEQKGWLTLNPLRLGSSAAFLFTLSHLHNLHCACAQAEHGGSPGAPPEQRGWFSNASMQKNWEMFKHRNPNTVTQV